MSICVPTCRRHSRRRLTEEWLPFLPFLRGGRHAVAEMQFADYIFPAFDQIVNGPPPLSSSNTSSSPSQQQALRGGGDEGR